MEEEEEEGEGARIDAPLGEEEEEGEEGAKVEVPLETKRGNDGGSGDGGGG